MPRVLLLFVDGVGLGEEDAAVNPFLQARLPVLTALAGGRKLTRSAAPVYGDIASVVGVDALLGGAGTPQSGTGQASLLTGVNAVAMHGRHFGPWVPARLQRMVREESLLADARAAGYRVAFANAYPEEALSAAAGRAAPVSPTSAASGTPSGPPADARAHDRRARRRRRSPSFLRAGPPLAALGAGLLTRHTAALARGEAVASELVNDGWKEVLGRQDLPDIAASVAGRNLANIAGAHDLTLFAHYATDYAGHRKRMDDAVAALERLDEFVGGLMEHLPKDSMLFMVSDHGNLEDVRTGHTRNPALGLVAGQGHALVARRLRALTDVAPIILDLLAL
ncbi:MAG TPA: alkaline phosphatase family protein [Longimicrobiales bacterium]|nr:alkaline phosphatase family protein [Longimicrobiales bacterium]